MVKQRGRVSGESLESDAKCDYIDIFQPMTVNYRNGDNSIEAIFSKNQHDTYFSIAKIEEGIIRRFPIIFCSNGLPWDLGNLYLMHKFSKAANEIEKPSIETLISTAHHLTAFLKWIEHSKKRNPETPINVFYLPDDELERVTYRYKRYLMKCIREGVISHSTASNRINNITALYRSFLENPELMAIDNVKNIENLPFQERTISISFSNRIGLKKLKMVTTTDLAIRIPRREHLDAIIDDGRKLHPLSENEQTAVCSALERMNSREFQLMCWIALYTGARIQTVCTLRVKDIAHMNNIKATGGFVYLWVGSGTGIDAKFQNTYNSRYKLRFPKWLVNLLYSYTSSNRAKERRLKSFYGDNSKDLLTCENYLFLNKDGGSYYTSERELRDRQNDKYSQRINAKNRINFPIARGQAIRNQISKLKKDIKMNEPGLNIEDFSFHDLRPTFGINYLETEIRNGYKPDIIINNLKTLMGHSNIATTYRYLSYSQRCSEIKSASNAYTQHIRKMLSKDDLIDAGL